MRIRGDFSPERTLKHISEIRIALNHLSAVDELRGLPGGDVLLKKGYELCKEMENLVEEAEKEKSGTVPLPLFPSKGTTISRNEE